MAEKKEEFMLAHKYLSTPSLKKHIKKLGDDMLEIETKGGKIPVSDPLAKRFNAFTEELKARKTALTRKKRSALREGKLGVIDHVINMIIEDEINDTTAEDDDNTGAVIANQEAQKQIMTGQTGVNGMHDLAPNDFPEDIAESTSVAKLEHPLISFIKEADNHLKDDTKARNDTGKGLLINSGGRYDTKGKLHFYNSNISPRGGSDDYKHKFNEEKAKGIHAIAKKHGFVQDKDKKHMYSHPSTNVKISIHHPDTRFYTDKYAGYWISTPRKAFNKSVD